MQIYGLQKTTLLDYPGHVACTVFTGHCNFRCPFCHNMNLVLHPDSSSLIPEEEFFRFLEKRRGILEGVAVSGGEPTLQPDLIPFLKQIRELGYRVKLDTNGYNPGILEEILKKELVDYVAMDLKSSPAGYARTAGLDSVDISRIDASVKLLMSGMSDYEFRTTVVQELHDESDFEEIGRWIAGAPAYYLQSFVDSDAVPAFGLTACSEEEMNRYLEILKPFVPNVKLRGI